MSSTQKTEVLVLGCGAGGMAVALAARRKGHDVIIVERQHPTKHTPSLRLSGGWIMTLTDAKQGAAYLSGCSGGQVDEDLFLPWAERNVHLEKWLEGINVRLILANPATWGLTREEFGGQMWAEHAGVPGSESVRVSRFATTLPSPFGDQGGMTGNTGEVIGGEAIYRGLVHAMLKNDIEIIWGTRALSLIVDYGSGKPAVKGVRVKDVESGEESEILAQRVVLATGGFGGNPDLVKHFLPVPNTKFYGNPDNEGDGLLMAMSVGAKLVRMPRMVGRGVISCPSPDGRELSYIFEMAGGGGGYVICDQTGRRYADESEQAQQQHTFYRTMLEFDPHQVGFTRSPSWWIFDERRRKAGPIPFTDRGTCAVGLYEWSADNQREIDAGYIAVGDTPGAAAVAAGATEAAGVAIDAEVAAYNQTCKAGKDPFGRPASTLLPLDSPPYYCMPLYIGGPYAHGGPQRDVLGRVIGTDGAPIPGLYSAGEMGQAVGLMYPASGASIAEALCLGELLGERLFA